MFDTKKIQAKICECKEHLEDDSYEVKFEMTVFGSKLIIVTFF